MTNQQALKEARRRFGPRALIGIAKKPTVVNGHVLSGRYKVGRNEMGLFFSVLGDGASWEHAFAMSTWNHHRGPR